MSKSIDQWIRTAALLGTVTVGFACASPLPERQPLSVSPVGFGSGEQREVSNLFVVADGSGSTYMADTFPEVKQLSQSFVGALPDKSARGVGGYEAGFIGFGGDDRVATALAPFDRGQLASTAAATKVMGQLDGTGGTTDIDDVLLEVSQQLEGKSGKSAVVLFSDGAATDPVGALMVAEALVESRQDPVCFHGVQVGDDPVGGAFLQQLADLSPCGSVRDASQVSNASAMQGFTKNVMVGKAMAAAPRKSSDPACSGTIRLRGIEFGFDKAEIDPVGAVVLDAAASTLAKCTNIGINVDGHTDSVGAEAYNQKLSERRAQAVSSYLSRKGISARRLAVRGFGETQPVADNSTDDGRARNRRVELTPR